MNTTLYNLLIQVPILINWRKVHADVGIYYCPVGFDAAVGGGDTTMMTVSWDRIILLYNPLTYETADVLSSYVYRIGLTKMQYSFATAVGLFNSAVNILLLIAANKISSRVSENSLW